MSSNLSERQQAEKAYHDELYKNTSEATVNRAATGGHGIYWDCIKDVRGLKVLDFGCGNGWVSIWLARQGAKVWGIDISHELINKARAWSEREGLEGSISFDEMPCEDLAFEDDFFDLVLGSAILHHTELPLALRSIARVLKPGGRALFIEPMNQNVLLKAWRALTPWRRSPTEKALTSEDIRLVRSVFPGAGVRYWSLLSIFTEGLLLAAPKSRLLNAANAMAQRLDGVVLKTLPALGKYSAVVILELRK